MDHPTVDCGHAVPPRLRAWYFEQRLGRPLPDDIDAAARELGFVDRADFDRAPCAGNGCIAMQRRPANRGDAFDSPFEEAVT